MVEIKLTKGVDVGKICTSNQSDFIYDSDSYIVFLDKYRRDFSSGICELSGDEEGIKFKKFYKDEIKRIDAVIDSVIDNTRFVKKYVPSNNCVDICQQNRKNVLERLDSLLRIIVEKLEND